MKSPHAAPLPLATAAALEARFAVRIAALMSEHSESLPHDVAERLKFARAQALGKLQLARAAAAAGTVAGLRGNVLGLLGGGHSLWLRLASILPLVALVAGLLLIQDQYSDAQIQVAADVDAALLADDLPPAAYSDAGFVEYLKTPRN